MTDRVTEIISKLREHAEWARANEWETPITLSDDLEEAAKALDEKMGRCEAAEQDIKRMLEVGNWATCYFCEAMGTKYCPGKMFDVYQDCKAWAKWKGTEKERKRK